MTSYKSRENLKAVVKSLLEVYTREEISAELDAAKDKKAESLPEIMREEEVFSKSIGQIQAVESGYGGNYPPGFDTRELD